MVQVCGGPAANTIFTDIEDSHKKYHQIGMEIEKMKKQGKEEQLGNKIVEHAEHSFDIIVKISALVEVMKTC